MPVEFLTTEQEARYGRFTSDPTPEQLARYFWLDDHDRSLIWERRGDHNQLGFAIQLGTVRFLGTFLPDPTDVPENVIHYVAEQLHLDAKSLNRYRASETRWDHTREISRIYDYHHFMDQPGHWRLVRWLYTRAWVSAERPSVLFDLPTARCVEKKILLPGVSVIARIVSQVRDRASTRLWSKLSRLSTPEQRQMLENLLEADPKNRKTGLDRLRRPHTSVTAPGIVKAVNRLEEIRTFGAEEWDITRLPVGRIRTLARYAVVARAQANHRMSPDRRIATLVAFIKSLTISAQDDVLDLLDRYLADLFARTNRREQKERLRTLRDLDGAARQLREVCAVLLQHAELGKDMKIEEIFSKISKENVSSAIRTVDMLTNPPDQTHAFSELFRHYSTIRQFFPKRMATLKWEATPAGRPVL